MTVTVKHGKTNSIADWTQADLDAQIELGNFPAGTTLADIVLPSDWNDDHSVTGLATVAETGSYNDLTDKPTLGTIASQNANNVAISGGAINGTTIGATTASTGNFTSVKTPSVTATTNDLTLSSISTGFVYLGTSNGNQVKITDATGDGTRPIQLNGGKSGGGILCGIGSSAGGLQINSIGNPIYFYTGNFQNTEQYRIAHTASAVNYVQVTGAATSSAPIISVQGSDANAELSYRTKGSYNHRFENGSGATNFVVDQTAGSSVVNRNYTAGSLTGIATRFYANGSDANISMAFQPKGTGAIDLAAGSRGVNISNGGTVTAITRTANGSGYTSFPSVAITAPTTAGGVQAVASVASMIANTATVANGGTGYTLNDVITLSGGTPTASAATYTVTGVTGGVITAVTALNFGAYSVLPSNPVSVTGGTGTGATLTVTWVISNSFTISNAGSGYIEQPQVTFSGGGGSGAAAYATVGSSVTIRSLYGNNTGALDFSTAASASNGVPVLRIRDSVSDSYVQVYGAGAGSAALIALGGANANMIVGSAGSGAVRFTTSGTTTTEQLRVSHTASAVNYVQVTGAATTGYSTISAQGSDTNTGLYFQAKGTASIRFSTAGANSNEQFRINNTASAVNIMQVTGAAAGSAPTFSVTGTDTNIDLALTPKGTGLVRFGTYTAGALLATGYINIKAADGTTYKVLVST